MYLKTLVADSFLGLLQRDQNKVVRKSAKSPWYTRNKKNHKDLDVPMAFLLYREDAHPCRHTRTPRSPRPLSTYLTTTPDFLARRSPQHIAGRSVSCSSRALKSSQLPPPLLRNTSLLLNLYENYFLNFLFFPFSFH